MDPDLEHAFWQLHQDLPRQAPGSDETTRQLLGLASLPTNQRLNALDVGCGPGRSSILLAEAGLNVTAIDTSQILLDQLRANITSRSELNVQPINMSMFEMAFPEQSFELIWSEGAVYIAGWEPAIKTWPRFLRPNGHMVLTECCWLTDTPSETTRQFWREGYPSMLTVDQATQIAEQNGLKVLSTLTLPDSDWWDEYYSLLENRIEELRKDAKGPLQDVLIATRKEIDLRKNYAGEYGYVGFVMHKARQTPVSGVMSARSS